MMWKCEIEIHMVNYSKHHFQASVQNGNNMKWMITGIYGQPMIQRVETWNLIKSLRSEDDSPWLVFGDFNKITCQGEKNGGCPRSERQMQMFKEALDHCNLRNLGWTRRKYNWCNGRDGQARIWERLDRFAANQEWINLILRMKVTQRFATYSDHIPFLLNTHEIERQVHQKKYLDLRQCGWRDKTVRKL